jgi:hypothetical protein
MEADMFSPAFRLILVAACLLLATRVMPGGTASWLLYAAAILLFVGFFRSGAIWLAWRAFLHSDDEEMERCLGWTIAPALLSPTRRAYYDCLQGVSARARGDVAGALSHLTAAASGRIPSARDRSLILVTLAEVQASLADEAAVDGALALLRSMNNPPEIESRVARLDRTAPAEA